MQTLLASGLVLCSVACGFDGTTMLGSSDGGGAGGNGNGNGNAVPVEECGEVTMVLRDFKVDHPDMQRAVETIKGLVQEQLDAEGKPLYAPAGSTSVTEGADEFAQWYRDTPGVNMRFEQQFALDEPSPGVFVFEDNSFFPLDGMGFPNEEIQGHNFHFTSELNATFRYRGGEQFTFKGDDDVFVFVNRRLALDLGGVHGVQEGTIDFDAQAADLGITLGEVYRLDVFHAERHTGQSNFRIETSIDCLGVVID